MSAVNDNIATGTGTSTAQIQADITSAITLMMRLEAENGKPFHQMPSQFVIVAPPNIMGNMNEALFAAVISQTSNVRNRGVNIEPIYTAHLTDTNDWYLLHTGGALRPLIFQLREPVSLESDTSGSHAFSYDQYRYKISGRYVVGYGHYANAVKVTNT